MWEARGWRADRKGLSSNGRSGEELHRREKTRVGGGRAPIRTQRTKLQSALLSQICPGTIQLAKKVSGITDLGAAGVKLTFKDNSSATADLVVGADGIRSVRSPLSTPLRPPLTTVHRQSATQPGHPTRSTSRVPPSGAPCSRGPAWKTSTPASGPRDGGTRPPRTFISRPSARASGRLLRGRGTTPRSTARAKSAGASPSPTRTLRRISRCVESQALLAE